jgi:hypothetical protein
MKKLTAVALAAALTVSVPALVVAQETTAPADPAATATDPAAGTMDPMAPPADFQGFITALPTMDIAANIPKLEAAPTIDVVKVSTLSGADPAALTTALEPVQEDITTLQTEVAANEAATSALEAEGTTPDKVIGIMAAADGAVTLYVNDLA